MKKAELAKIDKRKQVGIKAAKQAGKILLDNFGKPLHIKSKEARSLVTDIDLKAEYEITKLIRRNFPEDDLLCEEGRYPFLGSDFRWIIDPLDGTHNYIHNIDIFGTSIAVEYKGAVALGIIYMPVARELYVAQKGKGAYRNGKKLSVSKRNLTQCTMIYDSSIRDNKNPMLATLSKIVDKVFNIRMFGSTARSLSYIAEGKADSEIEFNDKVWDFAAGLLLVEEAGGKVTDFQGKKWGLHTRAYIASNGKVHEDVLRIMEKI